MKNLFLFLFIVLLGGTINAQNKTVWQDLFGEHFKPDCDKLEAWEERFSELDTLPSLKAWIIISQSNCPWNPVEKYAQFERGQALLDQAIVESKDPILGKFLRLTVQEHVPGFLGYNTDVETDRKYVLDHLDQITSKAYYSFIVDYLQRHPAEK